MNNEEPYRDQAERLRRRIERINEQTHLEEGESLPPREQVHREKKKKTKIKLKYPVIRLLVLIFILLPIIYFSVISYLDGKGTQQASKTSGDSVGFEPVTIENQKDNQSADKAKDQKAEQQQGNQPSGTDAGSEGKKEVPGTTEENAKDNTAAGQNGQNNMKNQPAASTTAGQTSTKTQTQPAQQNSGQKANIVTKQPQTSKTDKIIYHRVKPQETLYRIAIQYYNSNNGIMIIKNANHLQSDQVYAGELLKIPLPQ